MIKIKVKPIQSVILQADQLLLKELVDLCSYQKVSERAKRYSSACKGGWDGRVSLLNKYTGTFPTGLVPMVTKWLKERGYRVELEKALPASHEHPAMSGLKPLDFLRDYQKESIEKIIKCKRGVVQLPTGSGKTITAIGAVLELKRPTIFFVHTTDLLDQAISNFEKHCPGIKIGKVGDGAVNPGLITVASIQTVSSWLTEPTKPKRTGRDSEGSYAKKLIKYEEKTRNWESEYKTACDFLNQFSFSIIDECHHVAAETFAICASHCTQAEYLIGLSATPFRDDGADLLIEANSGPIIYSISLSEMIQQGYLTPAEIHLYGYPPLPPMVLPDKYDLQYDICINTNDGRNNEIVHRTIELLDQGFPTLLLCREVEHIDILAAKFDEKNVPHLVIHGKTKNRGELLDSFKRGEVPLLIGSDLFSEGVDIPSVVGVVNAAAGRSRVKCYQRLGRALRLSEGKTKAIIIDFRDEMNPFYYHFLDRQKVYKNETAFKVIDHAKADRKVIKKNLLSEKLKEFSVEIGEINF